DCCTDRSPQSGPKVGPLEGIMDSLQRPARLRTALLCMSLICMPVASSSAGGQDSAAMRNDGDRSCGGEPCGAVLRGLFGFFDRALGAVANARGCAHRR